MIKLGVSPFARRRRRAGPPLHAATAAYIAAMTMPPDATRRGHIDTLIAGLDADGDWPGIDWMVCLAAHDVVGGVSQAGRLNMKNPAKSLTAVNSPVFSALGVTGDGATSYLTAGETANAVGNSYSQNSACIGVWCNQQSGAAGIVAHAGNLNAAPRMRISPGTATSSHRINDATSLSYNGGSRLGGRILTRTGSTTKILYKDGVEVATDTAVSDFVQAADVCALRAGTSYCDDRLAFFFYGGGLSAAAVARIHARVQTFLAAIGAA
ncbi:hypothetical protein CNY89_10465 [Amaricoccus sp. HAR-UPW-R2A-40]|nr:hypothetical protein CNY89_10465 [Amaricoccus sp. HAR-UPW-R2A-40]